MKNNHCNDSPPLNFKNLLGFAQLASGVNAELEQGNNQELAESMGRAFNKIGEGPPLAPAILHD